MLTVDCIIAPGESAPYGDDGALYNERRLAPAPGGQAVRMTRPGIALCVLALSAQARAFGFDDVVARAQAAAAAPYRAPAATPQFLREVGYDQYRGMRYQVRHNLWAADRSRFQVTPVMPGGVYAHLIPINVVDGERVEPVAFHKAYFNFDDAALAAQIPDDLGYAGFELSYRFMRSHVQEKFLVFAGASYFRAVGQGQQWGLSARGAAIDTGLPTGEEFPDFVEYWLERPARDATRMTLYALLDSPRLAGAYAYVVTPGVTTILDVRSVLFPRSRIQLLGVAPLTSMYYYGENTPRPMGAWRPEVHDSDGLLIAGPQAQVWRPLLAPPGVRLEDFEAGAVTAFGLLQRDTRFAAYEDVGARYDQRPSALVEPKTGFEQGHVVLVQLPTSNEYLDNIVALWTPAAGAAPGARLEYAYSLRFGPPTIAHTDLGEAVRSFVGRDFVGANVKEGSYRLIADFRGGKLASLAPRSPVTVKLRVRDSGVVLEHQVERVSATGDWRFSVLVRPAPEQPLALQAQLVLGDQALTEVWDYELPPQAD